MKKVIKRVAQYGVLSAKKVVLKNPRLKASLKRVMVAQLSSTVVQGGYTDWLNKNLADYIDIIKLRTASDELKYKPLISILLPTYNTDPGFLHECLLSVKAQVYQNWELCIVDDASPNKEVRQIIEAYAADDARIKVKFLKVNQHISGATNQAAKLATGEFISLLDHDDTLWPNALYEIAKALNGDPTIDFLYTDEDKITENRHEHLGPFFKPDWNPDFLHSVNYITHFSTVRKSLFEKIGGFRKAYNGAQDWDLFLRITAETNKIYHIPKVVYSWRIHDLSTAKDTGAKPYVVEAQYQALLDDTIRRGYKDAVVKQDVKHNGYWHVAYAVDGDPLVSIVIPSKNQSHILKRCVNSIYAKTTYKNIEIVLVDTGSTDKRVFSWYRTMQAQHANFRLINWPEKPFSYSRSCNKGAEGANGEFLVMLNNDTEVITPDWIQLFLGDAQRNDIGAVGCLLFFPDGRHIQHAGVGVGLGGVAANSFSMMTLDSRMSQTQHLMLNTKHNMTVVTAACLMIKASLFKEIGGFDEKFRITYNDVDLCLRLYDKGYQNLYTPHVRLLHHESITVGLPEELKKRDTAEFRTAVSHFKKRWSKYIAHDPNINDNLSKDNAFYDL
jgi:GT2 family glycosyltransferase